MSERSPARRVVFWNILEGFHHPKAGLPPAAPPTLDEARVQAARFALAKLEPDVLVLNEALWCRPLDGYHVDFARLLGFAHQVADRYDGAWGNAILSHQPIVDSQRFRIHNRGGWRATVDLDGWCLEVATYHPHPDRRPFKKAEDFAALLDRAPLTGPFVIGGDFNAVSPDDQPDLDALAQGFARFAAHPRESAERFVRSGEAVMPVLQEHGLRDALPLGARQFTLPTDLLSTDKGSAMRLDHAWVNAAVEVLDAWVEVSAATQVASDHFPLVLDVAPAIHG